MGVPIFSLCLVAVNTFVLITGYYSCEQNVRLAKIAHIWIETVFYSIVLYLIACQIQGGVSPREFVKRILCITQERYWFISCYVMLLILSPVLNMIIKKCTHRELFNICLILIIILSIFPNLPFYSYDLLNVNRGFSVIWFCALYIFGGYIRKWICEGKYSRRVWLVLYIIACLIMAVSILLPYYLPWVIYMGSYTTYNSITCLLGAVSLFCFFREVKFEQIYLKKLIEIVAPLSLAVFLIHHNKDTLDFLWQYINTISLQNNFWLIPYLFVVACGIVIICLIVDYIRITIFELTKIHRLVQEIMTKIQDFITVYIMKVYEQLIIREKK